MAKLIIIEGPRGVFKSTVTRLLRDRIEGSTLINLTGFKENGQQGYLKIWNYYENVMRMIEGLQDDYTLIFDRHFFSEMVYSRLYKSYDFTKAYVLLIQRLLNAAEEIEVYYFTIKDVHVLNERLNRKKLNLFDSVPENVEETMKQQVGYDWVMSTFERMTEGLEHVTYRKLDTTNRQPEELADMIYPF